MPYVAAQAHLNMQAKNKSIKEMIVLLFKKKKNFCTPRANLTKHWSTVETKLLSSSGQRTGRVERTQVF